MSESAASQDKSAPAFDAKQVYADLTRLAETSSAETSSDRALLAYLLAMTNGQAAFRFKRGAKENHITCQEQLFNPAFESEAAAFLKAIEEEWHHHCDQLSAFIISENINGTAFKILVSPIQRSRQVEGFIAIALIASREEDLSPFLLILQTATGFLNYSKMVQDDPDENRWALDKTSQLVELTENVSGFIDFDEACLHLANELEAYFSCYRVAIGLKKLNTIQPIAVSNILDFDPKSTSSIALQAAMREAEKKAAEVQLPFNASGEKADAIEVAAHQELQRILNLSAVHSVPLSGRDGKLFGVLTFMWDEKNPRPERHERLIDASVPALTGIIQLLYRSRSNLFQKYITRHWNKWSERKRQIILYATAALLILLFLPSFPYRIDTRCTLEPVSQRMIAAPFNCILERALVEPGQTVNKGDILARLDGKELRAQLAELISRRDRAAKQADQAMAADDVPSFQVAQLEMESLNYEIEILSERTRQLEIRSPISGTVIAGDLERAEGVPLDKGQVMFEIGPLGEVVAECAIPENDIAHVREQMPVRIKINAYAGDSWTSQVHNLTPRSETRNNRNVFIAEAYIDNKDLRLKPGMQGKAYIEGEGKSLAWILFRKLWEFIQIRLLW